MSWLSGANRWIKGKSPFKVIAAIVGMLIALLIVAVATATFIFWHGEWERKKLIRSYELPTHFLSRLLLKERGQLIDLIDAHLLEKCARKGLFRNDCVLWMNKREIRETMVCAIDGYGSVENISSLSKRQRATLPKSHLPSEGNAWYLLFFTDDGISRIYLVDDVTLEVSLPEGSDGCVNRNAHFDVFKKQRPDGENYFVLNIANEGNTK